MIPKTACNGRVLIIDDEVDIREPLQDRLEAEGYDVRVADDGLAGLRRLRESVPDLVLLDLQMPRLDGMEVLRKIQAEHMDVTVVVITAYGSVARAVEAMRAGAYDFLQKPFDADQMRVVIPRALERARLREQNASLREAAADRRGRFIGRGPRVREILDVAQRAAEGMATILLLGESGTGKEVLAQTIHEWSPRRDQPFIAVNCVALSETLLESELFGHERGGFTGADRQRKGRFELARGGTLFLDELGGTKTGFQMKLLRVLQEGTFERVGGSQSIRADARIIAASNRDLLKAVSEGAFLPDLYYRLNVISIPLPPLRERREDIPELAGFFLEKYVRETKRAIEGLSEEAMESLRSHAWPGNVRELENAIECAVTLAQSPFIEPDDLPAAVVESFRPGQQANPCGFHALVEEFKRQTLSDALAQSGGNQTRAAERLGLQRSYFARLIRKLDVSQEHV